MKVISTIINEYKNLKSKFYDFDYNFKNLEETENQFKIFLKKDKEFANDETYNEYVNYINNTRNRIYESAKNLLEFEDEFMRFYKSFPEDDLKIVILDNGFSKEKVHRKNNIIIYEHFKSIQTKPDTTVLLDLNKIEKLKSIIGV